MQRKIHVYVLKKCAPKISVNSKIYLKLSILTKERLQMTSSTRSGVDEGRESGKEGSRARGGARKEGSWEGGALGKDGSWGRKGSRKGEELAIFWKQLVCHIYNL